MKEATFEQASELDMLWRAWEKVRGNRGAAGGDGVTVRQFEDGVGTRLARLQRDLRHGTYLPGPIRQVEIPKRSGGLRPLSIPCVADRVVQTACALVLGPILDAEMEDASFAYRPGRSVQMAIARVAAYRQQGFRWVVDGDIVRYFENVPHDRLLRRLERSVPDPQLVDLVALWLESFADDDRGLPQGSPISPLLANIYLDDVDERIAALGVRLVRFADDFVVLCKSEAAADETHRRIAAILAEYGLDLHPDKTRVVAFEKGFRFLGHLFVRSVVLKEVAVDDVAAIPDEAMLAALAEPVDVEANKITPERRSPGLRVLYLHEPGRRLTVRNQAFVVLEADSEIIAIPHQRVDRIELGPEAAVDDDALRHALATETRIEFVNGWGESIGACERPTGGRAGLHLAQARHATAPDMRLELACRIVDGRLRNQRALLRRLNRRRKDGAVTESAVAIGRALRKLDGAADIPELMGIEGEAAARYWPALGRTLEHGWTLELRRRRPPPDPVNLVISYLSSILHRDIHAFVVRRGLHPGFGALHTPRDGHPAAVSDLIEAFRAPLAEGLAVYLFNNRILRAEMFSPAPDGTGVRIDPEGRRAVIRGYEQWLDRPVNAPGAGQRVAWRRLIDLQVIAYAGHVRGGARFVPYVMDY